MGLFDKKFCDVCGEKIGLLGNRKLSDGNLCKDCAAKLSPFFTGRKGSTVAEIKDQLAYREANKAEVEKFNVTKTLGKNKFLFIDETAGNFMVSSRKQFRDENPDVMPLTSVTGVDIDTRESKNEDKRQDKDGKLVSYNPPHYDYSYDVIVTIYVNNKYFDSIEIKTSDDITISTIGNIAPVPTRNVQYNEAIALANEIKEVLAAGAEAVIKAAEPPKPVVCPHCGATTLPQNGCCEYCGGAL